MTVDAGVRLERVLRAMPAIAGRESVPIDDLTTLAGVDALTLLDDLRALTERDDEPGGFVQAITVLFDANAVSVRSPHFRRPMRITLPELSALELGLAMLANTATAAEREVIDRARARVRKAIVAMPASAAQADVWYASAPPASESILATLKECVSENEKVELVYQRGDSTESTQRVVRPYTVLPVRGKWFLAAHCEHANEVRFFRVDRIRSATRCGERFETPSGIARALLSAETRALSSSAVEQLVVRYSSRIARWIAEREEGEWGDDGSFTVRHPLADDAWAVRHVLQYGPEAVVIAPDRIRERLSRVLESMPSGARKQAAELAEKSS